MFLVEMQKPLELKIGSLQVHAGYLTFFFKKKLYV